MKCLYHPWPCCSHLFKSKSSKTHQQGKAKLVKYCITLFEILDMVCILDRKMKDKEGGRKEGNGRTGQLFVINIFGNSYTTLPFISQWPELSC